MADTRHLRNLEQKLIENGLLMEAGWIGFRLIINNHHKMSALELGTAREAFFAGAQHVFSSLVRGMDPEQEPTDDDEERVTKLAEELEEHAQAFRLKYEPAKGTS